MDAQLRPWLKRYHEFYKTMPRTAADQEVAFRILYEAAIDLYLSVLVPNTTRSTKGILTRCLIECYADVHAIFRHRDPVKQAKRYTKYALKLKKYYSDTSLNYKIARDVGDETTRPFELVAKSQTCWNGHDITSRVIGIDGGKNFIGYYEFFSIFTHVSPVRQLYVRYFDEPFIGKYYSHMMLLIMKVFAEVGYVPDDMTQELISIIDGYSAYAIANDISPPRK